MDKLDYELYFGTLMDKTDNMKKHPYYDSDRKKKTQESAMKMIAYSFIAMMILIGLSLIFK